MGWVTKKDKRVVNTVNELHEGDRELTPEELDELIGGDEDEAGDN